jgi:hypothetical protein
MKIVLKTQHKLNLYGAWILNTRQDKTRKYLTREHKTNRKAQGNDKARQGNT